VATAVAAVAAVAAAVAVAVVVAVPSAARTVKWLEVAGQGVISRSSSAMVLLTICVPTMFDGGPDNVTQHYQKNYSKLPKTVCTLRQYRE
jgi:hypothetical protein